MTNQPKTETTSIQIELYNVRVCGYHGKLSRGELNSIHSIAKLCEKCEHIFFIINYFIIIIIILTENPKTWQTDFLFAVSVSCTEKLVFPNFFLERGPKVIEQLN